MAPREGGTAVAGHTIPRNQETPRAPEDTWGRSRETPEGPDGTRGGPRDTGRAADRSGAGGSERAARP